MKSLRERFWSKVDKSGDCWLWTAYTNRAGYGCMKADGKDKTTSRVSWELANGPIPEGLCVLHRCDVPACVNPAHLFLGTVTDNNRDRAAKGRNRDQRGNKNNMAKLDPLCVQLIREIYAGGKFTQCQLAAFFEVGQSLISDVVRRVTWRHIV